MLTLCGLSVVFWLEGYPIFILAIVLGGFAAAPMATLGYALFGAEGSWDDVWLVAVGCYKKYFGFMALWASLLIPFCIYPVLRQRRWDAAYDLTIMVPLIALACLALHWAARRIVARRWVLPRSLAITVCVVLLGASFAQAVREHLNNGWNWIGEFITLDGGRVASLKFLREISRPGARVATSHHCVDLRYWPERSFVYAAVSHRCMLLEGFADYDPEQMPPLEEIRWDNDRLFTTRRGGGAGDRAKVWRNPHSC